MTAGSTEPGREGRTPWDQLSVPEPVDFASGSDKTGAVDSVPGETGPSGWARMAAGWADLVVVGIMTTGILLAVITAGYSVGVAAMPWAAGVAVLWWVLCAVLCVRIRRGTPGMLIAGVMFSDEVAGYRLLRTILAAAFIAVFLGLPALPGGRDRTLFSLASGSPLVAL
jgi:hypothetical protein